LSFFFSSFVDDTVAYHRKDSYYRNAKREGYRSRAAYKLMELDTKLGLFRSGMTVLDLGCAPGGWCQVAARKVGKKGRVLGIDRNPTEPFDQPQIELLVADLVDPGILECLRRALSGPVDVVLSDMAPDTSGVGFADHARSIELAGIAVGLAREVLAPTGLLVVKVFDGSDINELVGEMESSIGRVRRIHLKSTRKGSREIYLSASRGAKRGSGHGNG
jgi:23S rRNA (uridine2552-2'-O)-methyltransferase